MKKDLSFSYLDFEGRPVYILPDQRQLSSEYTISIEYDFDNVSIMKKPLIVFGFVFCLLLVTIIFGRMKLEAFA